VKDNRAVLIDDRRRLLVVLAVTAAYFVSELAGGYYANSLALLTDAIHMLTDIAALCLSSSPVDFVASEDRRQNLRIPARGNSGRPNQWPAPVAAVAFIWLEAGQTANAIHRQCMDLP